MTEQNGLPGIDNPAQEVISQREFAKLVGVSSPAITKAIDRGRLSKDSICQTARGPQLYRERALAEWAEIHAEQEVDGEMDLLSKELASNASADSADVDTIRWSKLKTKGEALAAGEKAKLLYMERLELEGKLLRAEDVEEVWAEIVSTCRTSLLALPGKIAGSLALRSKKDRVTVQEILDREIERALADLSNDAGERIQRGSADRTGRSR